MSHGGGDQLDINFEAPDLRRMVHRGGLETERQSAVAVAPRLNAIQREVLEAFRELGPMTAETIERLPRFAIYAPSTVRKRCSELYAAGDLVTDGTVKNSRGRLMTVWKLP